MSKKVDNNYMIEIWQKVNIEEYDKKQIQMAVKKQQIYFIKKIKLSLFIIAVLLLQTSLIYLKGFEIQVFYLSGLAVMGYSYYLDNYCFCKTKNE